MRKNTQENGFRDALLSVLLDPALQLAAGWGVTLADLNRIFETSYFRVHRERHTVQKCGERMGISIRQCFRIKQLADADGFASELALAQFPRRVLLELVGQNKSALQLSRVLGESIENVQNALHDLAARNHVAFAGKPGHERYRLRNTMTRLVDPQGLRFVEGIRFALVPILHTVLARTTPTGDAPRSRKSGTALARVFSFPARGESLAREADLMLGDLLARMQRLDTEATLAPQGDDVRVQLSLWLAAEQK